MKKGSSWLVLVFQKQTLQMKKIVLFKVAIDFLEMTAEANIFDDIMAQVSDAIQNITNTGEDAAIDVENDVGKLSDISVDDKEVVFKYYNKLVEQGTIIVKFPSQK